MPRLGPITTSGEPIAGFDRAGFMLPNDPSADVIAERCAEIRRKWSPAERQKRTVTLPVAWTVPEVATG